MNNNIKILINVAAFIVCAAVGFVLTGMVRNSGGGAGDSSASTRVVVAGGSGGVGTDMKTAKKDGDVKKVDDSKVGIITSGSSDATAEIGTVASSSTAAIENTAYGTDDVHNEVELARHDEVKGTMPEISGSRRAAPKSSTEVNKLGYAFYTTATVASGDALTYSLYKKGDSTPAYTSKNGRFDDVYPVEGGIYRLVVKNDRTGDSAEADVTGFDKVQKWSRDKLEEQLNSMNREKMFFFHFDNNKLKFECTGLDDVPATLNALLADKAAMGWTVKVLDTPVFDSYNRITFFRIQIISE